MHAACHRMSKSRGATTHFPKCHRWSTHELYSQIGWRWCTARKSSEIQACQCLPISARGTTYSKLYMTAAAVTTGVNGGGGRTTVTLPRCWRAARSTYLRGLGAAEAPNSRCHQEFACSSSEQRWSRAPPTGCQTQLAQASGTASCRRIGLVAKALPAPPIPADMVSIVGS